MWQFFGVGVGFIIDRCACFGTGSRSMGRLL